MSTQLVVATAGAVVGFAIGGPAGAQVGWAIGSAVGASMGPAQQVQGPRLSDLKFGSSEYGSTIPYVEGHPRVPAMVIWASDKREIPNTESQGGKGGPQVDSTTFTYEIDLLILLSENTIGGVSRIWSNGKLIWTALDSADADSLEASASAPDWTDIRFYTGADDQLPDPTYEAAVGTANAPAYRGRGTAFVEGLQLGGSGQLPNLTFEISGPLSTEVNETIKFATAVAPAAVLGASNKPFGAMDFGSPSVISSIDLDRRVSNTTVSGSGLELAVAQSGELPGSTNVSTAGTGTGNRAVMVLGANDDYPARFTVAGDSLLVEFELPDVDNWIGRSEIRFAIDGDFLAVSTSVPIDYVGNFDSAGSGIPYAGNQGRIYVYDVTDDLLHRIEAGIPVESMALRGSRLWALHDGDIYPFTGIGSDVEQGDTFSAPDDAVQLMANPIGVLHAVDATATVWKWDDADSAWSEVVQLVHADDLTVGCIYSITSSSVYVAKGVSFTAPNPIYYYKVRGAGQQFRSFREAVDAFALVFFDKLTPPTHTWGDPIQGARALKDASISWESAFAPPPSLAAWDVHYGVDAWYGYPHDTGDGVPGWIHFTTLIIVDQFPYSPVSFLPTYAHDLYKCVINPSAELVEPTLADVVTRQCLRAGLTEGDIDVSELEVKSVRAMALTQVSSPRQVIDILAAAYFFEVRESDRLYFPLRGVAPVASISYSELGCSVDGGDVEPLNIVKTADTELPSKFSVTFANVDDDYQNGTTYSDRITSDSTAVQALVLPLGLSATEAKVIVDAMALDTQVSSLSAKIALNNDYAHLEPTDVLLVEGDDGTEYRMRVVRKTESDGVHELELVQDDAGVLDSLGVVSTDYVSSTTVRLSAETEMELLDIPLLRDADDDAGFMAAVKGAGDNWHGTVIYGSDDDTVYTRIGTITTPAVFGVATTALGNWIGGDLFDESNTVTVSIGNGELSSTARNSLLTSTVNAALIGSEIIQYRTATLVDTGIYKLSGLLRGRRGTEWAIASHTSSERFVVLQNVGLRHISMDSSDLGITKYYKGVSIGKNIASTDSESFSNNGIALKPFAPVDLRAERDLSGNITLTWKRRTRLSTRFTGSIGISVPLGESVEQYKVEIYDDMSYANLIRTISGLSSASASYTSAQQVSDLGFNQPTVYVRVYQYSSSVGYGYKLEASA